MLTTLVALTLIAPQAAEQEPGGFTFAGRKVPVRFPGPVSTEPPTGFLEWDGWQYGKGLRLPDGGFQIPGDWTPFAQSSPAENAIPWRVKIVVFTATDVLDRYDNGLIRQRRGYIEGDELNEVLQSIARYRAILASRTGGKLRFEPDVSIDTDFVRDEVAAGEPKPFGLAYIHEWIRSHVNGGSYQAEDSVYRGPYHGVVAIVPGNFPVTSDSSEINGTQVDVRYLVGNSVQPGQVEQILEDAFKRQAVHRLEQAGYVPAPDAPVPDDLLNAFDLADPSPEQMASRSGNKAYFGFADNPVGVAPASSWKSTATELGVVPDPDRGNVLRYKEKSSQRSSGFMLPVPEGGFSGKTLSFFVRSKNSSPLSIYAVGEGGKAVRYSLGRDLLPPPNMPTPEVLPTAFVGDNTWQKVSLDLSPVGRIQGIGIAPTPNSLLAERLELDRVEYDFDDFTLNDDPTPKMEAAADPEMASALKAVAAMKSGTPSPELANMLLSPSNLVVLNALNAYTVIKDPAVLPQTTPVRPKDPKAPLPPPVPDLRNAVSSLSPRRQEFAVRAAANQDSDLAWSFIRRQIVVGPSDIAKGIAIEVLAKKAPAGFQSNVLSLVPTGRFAKLKAAEALASAPSSTSSVGLSLLMKYNDPFVTLKVTEEVRPNDDLLMRQTMWSAVNEPWDAIRLESLKKLVQSKDPMFQSEGYKGVRDDSVWVRQSLVEWMMANPTETHGPALRLALTDSSYRVRQAALLALKTQPGEVKAEEVQSLRNDPYPQVRAAYLELAKAKGLPN